MGKVVAGDAAKDRRLWAIKMRIFYTCSDRADMRALPGLTTLSICRCFGSKSSDKQSIVEEIGRAHV